MEGRLAVLVVLLLAVGASAKVKKVDNSKAPFPVSGKNFTIGFQYKLTDKRVVHVFTEANASVGTLSATWTTEQATKTKKKKPTAGIPTVPGSRIVAEVPKRFREGYRTIDRIWLLHRKPAENKTLLKKTAKLVGPPAYTWDSSPTYHTVACRDPDTKKWRVWKGPRYFTLDGEPRTFSDPEADQRRYAPPRVAKNVYYDHIDDLAVYMGTGKCDLVMVENLSEKGGLGIGQVHGLRIEYRPQAEVDEKEQQLHVATKSTMFEDFPYTKKPHFGGGREVTPGTFKYQHNSIYPGALKLDPADGKPAKPVKKGVAPVLPSKRVNDWLAVVAGGLIIRLKTGKHFAQCEVAIGNRQPYATDPKSRAKIKSKKNPSIIFNNPPIDHDGWVGGKGTTKVFASLRAPGVANGTQVLLAGWSIDDAVVLRLAPNNNFTVPSPPPPNNTALPPGPQPYGGAFIRLDVVGDPAYVMAVRCEYFAKAQPPVAVPFKPVVTKPAAPPADDKKTNGTVAKPTPAPAPGTTTSPAATKAPTATKTPVTGPTEGPKNPTYVNSSHPSDATGLDNANTAYVINGKLMYQLLLTATGNNVQPISAGQIWNQFQGASKPGDPVKDYRNYYAQYTNAYDDKDPNWPYSKGIPIIASKNVPAAALLAVRNAVVQLYGARKWRKQPWDVRDKMVQFGHRVVVKAATEQWADHPEVPTGVTPGGASEKEPTAFIDEGDVCYPNNKQYRQDRTVEVLVHSMHEMAIKVLDPAAYNRIIKAEALDCKKGLWQRVGGWSHRTLVDEYFAAGARLFYGESPSSFLLLKTKADLRAKDPRLFCSVGAWFDANNTFSPAGACNGPAISVLPPSSLNCSKVIGSLTATTEARCPPPPKNATSGVTMNVLTQARSAVAHALDKLLNKIEGKKTNRKLSRKQHKL